jgi:hypothetical protein
VAGLAAAEIDRRWAEQNGPRLADNAGLLDAVAEVKWEDWTRWQGKLHIDRLEVAGPLRPEPPSGGWTLLDELAETNGSVEALLRELLPRAFRRPVLEDEVSRYAELSGGSREDGLSVALTAILTSPRFLYRDELPVSGGDAGGDRALDDFAMASRLSYFLWQTMPDAELFDLAASGLLADPATLAEQADRMLDDPKADAFFEAFSFDWLGIRELGRGIRPDPSRFPEFTEELGAQMREEAVRTVAAVFRGDRPVLELIDSATAHLTGKLAQHYGMPGWRGTRSGRWH